jgi:hypothetical protein
MVAYFSGIGKLRELYIQHGNRWLKKKRAGTFGPPIL